MTEEIKRRDDHRYEVSDGGQWLAGPFNTHEDALKWIRASLGKPKLVLPDDIRRTANQIEASYIQRIAMEDLAYLIGSAIAEERRRCVELALGMKNQLIDAGGGLMRRPTFDDLADKMREGSI